VKILLSAFACDPSKGSEPGYGWNWATGLASKGFEVHCITRAINAPAIKETELAATVTFHYIALPLKLEKLYSKSQSGMYLYYLLWQYLAYRKAKKLHKKYKYNVAHHVTWGSVQQGSFLYRLPIPFIFGPAGGGQKAPEAFKDYFKDAWKSEIKREQVSRLLLKLNPSSKKMFKRARSIWASNPDTEQLLKKYGANKVYTTLDAALPASFFPRLFKPKTPEPGRLNLLWVGRLMPRKGILLLLDVMEQLKEYPGITLTVVGDGEQTEVFLETLKEKRLDTTVFWEGKIPHEKVRDYYATHDVFVFASLRDSCPAQLIEAMAFGMPVVTLDLHGQSIIVNDETGFRCKCQTPSIAIEELKKGILKLLNVPSLVPKMSVAAHEFAKQQTWEKKIKVVVEQSYPK
jgi:glycosyltransferase involved in cell wall biosynthesis